MDSGLILTFNDITVGRYLLYRADVFVVLYYFEQFFKTRKAVFVPVGPAYDIEDSCPGRQQSY